MSGPRQGGHASAQGELKALVAVLDQCHRSVIDTFALLGKTKFAKKVKGMASIEQVNGRSSP